MTRIPLIGIATWDIGMVVQIISHICAAPAIGILDLTLAAGAVLVHALVFGQ